MMTFNALRLKKVQYKNMEQYKIGSLIQDSTFGGVGEILEVNASRRAVKVRFLTGAKMWVSLRAMRPYGTYKLPEQPMKKHTKRCTCGRFTSHDPGYIVEPRSFTSCFVWGMVMGAAIVSVIYAVAML